MKARNRPKKVLQDRITQINYKNPIQGPFELVFPFIRAEELIFFEKCVRTVLLILSDVAKHQNVNIKITPFLEFISIMHIYFVCRAKRKQTNKCIVYLICVLIKLNRFSNQRHSD